MSYLVLARKYRPPGFNEVCGQEHVTRTLRNSIMRDRVAHAHLFCGPRGVGKTSIARIFAKALNCVNGPTPDPCLECSNCHEIAEGNSLAVREIDGASHNSVEHVRDLIESFRSVAEPGSRYKVYIIDEVHMLSTAAFNALLKSLEEPPPNTVFILATTEAHKIPETVISRCQRHEFRSLGGQVIEKRLKEICEQENIKFESEALSMIARLSDGSMRDAQSLLDRVQAFCEGSLTVKDTGAALGMVERGALLEISRLVFAHDPNNALSIIQELFSTGIDPVLFLRDFANHWRELLLAKFASGKSLSTFGIPDEFVVELQRQVEGISELDLQDLVSLAREGADRALRSAYPKYSIESLLVRLATRVPVKDFAKLIHEIESGVAFSKPALAPKKVPAKTASKVKAKPAPAAKPAAPKPQEKASTVQDDTDAELTWPDFVQFVSNKKDRMFVEQLKRISIKTFEVGRLEASAPEFSAAYLNKPEQIQRFQQYLEQFSNTSNWRIKVEAGENQAGPEPGSLWHEEKAVEQKKSEQRRAAIENHPSIKTLQEVFPGSEIENIVTKE